MKTLLSIWMTRVLSLFAFVSLTSYSLHPWDDDVDPGQH
jgi:hypothetical protein